MFIEGWDMAITFDELKELFEIFQWIDDIPEYQAKLNVFARKLKLL